MKRNSDKRIRVARHSISPASYRPEARKHREMDGKPGRASSNRNQLLGPLKPRITLVSRKRLSAYQRQDAARADVESTSDVAHARQHLRRDRPLLLGFEHAQTRAVLQQSKPHGLARPFP